MQASQIYERRRTAIAAEDMKIREIYALRTANKRDLVIRHHCDDPLSNYWLHSKRARKLIKEPSEKHRLSFGYTLLNQYIFEGEN